MYLGHVVVHCCPPFFSSIVAFRGGGVGGGGGGVGGGRGGGRWGGTAGIFVFDV